MGVFHRGGGRDALPLDLQLVGDVVQPAEPRDGATGPRERVGEQAEPEEPLGRVLDAQVEFKPVQRDARAGEGGAEGAGILGRHVAGEGLGLGREVAFGDAEEVGELAREEGKPRAPIGLPTEFEERAGGVLGEGLHPVAGPAQGLGQVGLPALALLLVVDVLQQRLDPATPDGLGAQPVPVQAPAAMAQPHLALAALFPPLGQGAQAEREALLVVDMKEDAPAVQIWTEAARGMADPPQGFGRNRPRGEVGGEAEDADHPFECQGAGQRVGGHGVRSARGGLRSGPLARCASPSLPR